MNLLPVLAGLMMVGMAALPSAFAQGSDGPMTNECNEVLEAVYGVEFENCVPSVDGAGESSCLSIAGIPLVCAHAVAGVSGPIYENPAAICPGDGNVNEQLPTIKCWERGQAGACTGLLQGVCYTQGWIAQACFWQPLGGCDNPWTTQDIQEPTVYPPIGFPPPAYPCVPPATAMCITVTTTAQMIGGTAQAVAADCETG